MRKSYSYARWAGYSALLQIFALFYVEDLSDGRPIVVIPMGLMFISMMLNVDAWIKGKQ